MSRYAMCPICGHRMNRVKDYDGNWDGETYECRYCYGDDSDMYDGTGGMSIHEAAMIWASNGKDEDYTFGFSEEDLEEVL